MPVAKLAKYRAGSQPAITFASFATRHQPSTNWLTTAWHTFNHMVELSSARLDRVFHALADATRRDMLRRLAAGEHTVSELAEPFHMSLAAASKHIRTLEDAGLIHRTVRRPHPSLSHRSRPAGRHRPLAAPVRKILERKAR